MGRPKGGTNIFHTKDEKLSLVLRNLAGEGLMSLERETGIYNAQICKWTKQYLEGGEDALVNKRTEIYQMLYLICMATLLQISVWKSMKRLGISGYVLQQKSPETKGSEHNRYSNEKTKKKTACSIQA